MKKVQAPRSVGGPTSETRAAGPHKQCLLVPRIAESTLVGGSSERPVDQEAVPRCWEIGLSWQDLFEFASSS